MQAIPTKIDEFVIDMSNWPKAIDIILIMENCSSGEKINIIRKKNKKSKKLTIGIEPIFYAYKTNTLPLS